MDLAAAERERTALEAERRSTRLEVEQAKTLGQTLAREQTLVATSRKVETKERKGGSCTVDELAHRGCNRKHKACVSGCFGGQRVMRHHDSKVKFDLDVRDPVGGQDGGTTGPLSCALNCFSSTRENP